MDMSYTIEVMAFFDIFAYFGQNLVAMETSLGPLQSELPSSDWSTTIKTENPIISIYLL